MTEKLNQNKKNSSLKQINPSSPADMHFECVWSSCSAYQHRQSVEQDEYSLRQEGG